MSKNNYALMINKSYLLIVAFLLSFNSFGEDGKLEYYLKDENIRYAVAQLFVVGYPADIVNYTSCGECDYLVNELKIGGIMLNQYNLPENKLRKYEKSSAFRMLTRLVQDIDIRSRGNIRTKYVLPPSIVVDFENYRYASIKYPLSSIPSALAIASSGDTTNAYLGGKLAGYHLGQAGIDVILGPVLDKNLNMVQGVPNSTIRDRAFSDRQKIIYAYASEYIKGLKTSRMNVFAKHYPSYSSIDGNAHSTASSFIGSYESLRDDLEIFKELDKDVDGFMTSHLNIGETSSYLPFTFSRNQVEGSFRSEDGVDSRNILITDDLSNMQPVKTYMSDRHRTFAQISLDAFLAGHDLLLFSHYGKGQNFNKKETWSLFYFSRLCIAR